MQQSHTFYSFQGQPRFRSFAAKRSANLREESFLVRIAINGKVKTLEYTAIENRAVEYTEDNIRGSSIELINIFHGRHILTNTTDLSLS